MTKSRARVPIDRWNDESIPAGESRDVTLAVGESYSGMTVQIPIHIRRAVEEGPVVFVTAALHGDEINGTGAIRQLIHDEEVQLLRGTVLFVPVLNLPAFDRHSRYLPDRRDLNRCFPGSSAGSLASRMARTIFDEIVLRCDYGIDLHTAAVRRTNYPTVRGDMRDSTVAKLAKSFGGEIILNGKGPKGALSPRGMPKRLPHDYSRGRGSLESRAVDCRNGGPGSEKRPAASADARWHNRPTGLSGRDRENEMDSR